MVDLSSDTQTRPVTTMRAAIARAEVGDEQKGEDPTVVAPVAARAPVVALAPPEGCYVA